MFHKVITYTLLLLLIALGCASGEDAKKQVSAGEPILAVSEWYFDFGEVYEGEEYQHEFTIENHGTGTLEITKITPG